MTRPERKAARGQREQLLTLLNGWDPAGVLAGGAPRNAYETLADKLLALLSRRASADEVAKFLEREVSTQFGTDAIDAPRFATKAVSWFEMS